MKIVVWDLCGGSQNSVYQALCDNSNFEVYTFDITEPTRDNHIKLDLTSCFDNIQNVLDTFPIPDIIVASPMCNSFSFIMNAGNNQFNERLGWKYDQEKQMYVIRDENEIKELSSKSNFLKNNVPEKIINRCLVGSKLLDNIIKIIYIYKPKYWYIENPQKSLMWDFIKSNHRAFMLGKRFFNLTYYYNYDLNYTKKPTIFFSNCDLDLKHITLKKDEQGFIKRNNQARSLVNSYKHKLSGEETGANVKIPKNLLIDIFNKFLELLKQKEI